MIAFLNGHTRPKARSADTIDVRLLQANDITSAIDATSGTINFLTVNTSTTFSGTTTFVGPMVLPNAITATGAAQFQNDVAVGAGHVMTVGSATTLAAGATVSGTLVLTGAVVGGSPTFTGGATVAPGQVVTLLGTAPAHVNGNFTLPDGVTIASGRTLTFTGATLDAGGTGVITGLLTLNIRANTVMSRRYGAPVPITPGNVFPTLRPPANSLGVFVLDATSFSGEASNGTNSGGVRGSTINTTGARATAVDNTDCALQDFVLFNRSPYSFYLLNNTFQNQGEMSMVVQVHYPLCALRCSRASFPGGASTLWKATSPPLTYTSGWASLSPALLTSADCTFDLYRHQYAVTAAGPGNNRLGLWLTGQLLIHFTKAAADPVRIQVPLPVGPIAETAYPAVSGFTPRCGVFRDWMVSASSMFPESATAFVGKGELARALGTYARTDATATVGAYIENGDANAGYLRVVASGFTGGAGSYKLRCNYRVPMENVVFRPTYDTFSYVV